MSFKLIEEKDTGRLVLTQAGHAYCVSAAKMLLDALNTNDPYHALYAYERLEPLARAVREADEKS